MPNEPEESGMIADRVLTALRKNCVLTYVDFHRYEGLIRLDAVEQIIDGVSLPADGKWLTKSSLKMLPDSWQTPLNVIEGKARRAITAAAGILFKRGVYLIPVEKAAEILGTLHRLKNEYHEAARELCQGYPEVLEDFESRMREKFGIEKFQPIWAYLKGRIYGPDEILRRYSMEVGIWPIGAENTQLMSLVDEVQSKVLAVDQSRFEKYGWHIEQIAAWDSLKATLTGMVTATAGSHRFTSATLEAHLRTAREATDRLMQETIERAFQEPREELEAAIDRLLQLQAEGSTRLGGAVNVMQRAWSNLEAWKWLAPAHLADKMNQVKAGLNSVTGFDVSKRTDLGVRVTNSLISIRESLASSHANVRFLDLSD